MKTAALSREPRHVARRKGSEWSGCGVTAGECVLPVDIVSAGLLNAFPQLIGVTRRPYVIHSRAGGLAC